MGKTNIPIRHCHEIPRPFKVKRIGHVGLELELGCYIMVVCAATSFTDRAQLFASFLSSIFLMTS
jgi:hypothetical protein